MNKELENWFRKNDDYIRQYVNDLIDRNNLSVEFKGYYIEDNKLVINGPARPFYNNYQHYKRNNPYSEITHIRYFFEISRGSFSKIMTIILEKEGEIHLGFSIEELGGGVSLNDSGRLLNSDFALLETYVKSKFL